MFLYHHRNLISQVVFGSYQQLYQFCSYKLHIRPNSRLGCGVIVGVIIRYYSANAVNHRNGSARENIFHDPKMIVALVAKLDGDIIIIIAGTHSSQELFQLLARCCIVIVCNHVCNDAGTNLMDIKQGRSAFVKCRYVNIL